jgi:cysteinyl-tRNA synthetase
MHPKNLQFFNTLSRKKEIFEPKSRKEVTLYTCGPTVYNFAHIGNFRTYVFEDILRRTLEFAGYHVHHVMNLTDVDDKTIKGALAKQLSLTDFTNHYITAFFEDVESLGLLPAKQYPKATDHIPSMIAMIENLVKKGYAYAGSDGNVYFRIAQFAHYGCLSHLPLEDLKEGASNRVAQDEYERESISDFVLWKAYNRERDGDVYWESPFGRGRPGWHIECSAMATELLGPSIDIHCGGVDNIFPHHENEIAQSEATFEKPFARYWLHSEHLVVDGKKMSKSLNNFYTIRDLLNLGYSGVVIRFALMQTHYRNQLNFSLASLDAAKHSLQRIHDFVHRLNQVKEQSGESAKPLLELLSEKFISSMCDDLNIAGALGALFDFIREINIRIDHKTLTKQDAEIIHAYLCKIDHVFNVIRPLEDEVIPESVIQLLNLRQEARKNKDFSKADYYRDEIEKNGYVIEDSKEGPQIKKRLK